MREGEATIPTLEKSKNSTSTETDPKEEDDELKRGYFDEDDEELEPSSL